VVRHADAVSSVLLGALAGGEAIEADIVSMGADQIGQAETSTWTHLGNARIVGMEQFTQDGQLYERLSFGRAAGPGETLDVVWARYSGDEVATQY
jgi:hypothetical protein